MRSIRLILVLAALAVVAASVAIGTPPPISNAELSAAPILAAAGTGALEPSGAVVPEEVAPDGRRMRAGSLIVKFRPNAGPNDREVAHRDAGAVAAEPLPIRDTERVQIEVGTAARALAIYRSWGQVLRVEPDYLVRASFQPNDSRYSEQWGPVKISAPSAWDRTHSSSSVKIAILDCGIFSSSSSRSGPNGRGHIDVRSKIVLERNFTTSADADDRCNHGTHVAGIAAASTNNGTGVAGVGFDASILNGKVLDDAGSGTSSWITAGIVWAADNGAKVINMSLGAAGSCPASVQDAIDYAWSRGAITVAAAGNSAATGADFPANCAKVTAVTATDKNDLAANFSNTGPNVDVAAPGVSILSSDNQGGYSLFSGTSMATPHVAGLAALVWPTSFGTGAQAVVDRILNTADRIPGTGALWANGRVNAAAAVGAPTPTATPIVTLPATPVVTLPTIVPLLTGTAGATATPTRTPTPAFTFTPTSTPCSPRPKVSVQTKPDTAGRLVVAITAGLAPLRELRFGAATNAWIDAGSETGRTGNFTQTMPPGTQQAGFTVRRVNPGAATTVHLVVVDECGDWPTFVGGGPSAF